MPSQLRKNQADADAYKIATRELQTALDTLSKQRDMTEVEKEYLDTVRRMAVVQVSNLQDAVECPFPASCNMPTLGLIDYHAADPDYIICLASAPQIKQAKLARELQASVAGEKALTERVTELEEEVRDVSSTTRGRIRWLEQSGEQTRRRLEQLFRELEASVPLTVG